MNTKTPRLLTLCLAFAVTAGLASCSSLTREKSSVELRKEGYETLLKKVKPGMYRRQLYAVLPSYRKPIARPPVVGGTPFMLPCPPDRYPHWAHQELHKLDDECWLVVNYQLKDGNEYPAPPEPRNGTSIDGLLTKAMSPSPPRMTHSRENPDDIIFSISNVCQKSKATEASDFQFSTHVPTQEQGILFGRALFTQQEFEWLLGIHSAGSPPKSASSSPKPMNP